METNQPTNVAPGATAPAAADGDRFDDMDCRAESSYPEANRDAATPDFIKQALAGKQTDAPPDPASATPNENPA